MEAIFAKIVRGIVFLFNNVLRIDFKPSSAVILYTSNPLQPVQQLLGSFACRLTLYLISPSVPHFT